MAAILSPYFPEGKLTFLPHSKNFCVNHCGGRKQSLWFNFSGGQERDRKGRSCTLKCALGLKINRALTTSSYLGQSLGGLTISSSKWTCNTWLDNSAKVDIDVPVEEAWSLWEDPSAVVGWMPWITSVQVLNRGEEGPLKSRWTLSYEAFQQKFEFSWLAQNLQPIHLQKRHWRSIDGLPNRGAVRFFKRGPSACTVELTISYEVPDVLAPFARGLTPLVERIIGEDMGRFAAFAKRRSLQASP